MFTGIIEATGTVRSVRNGENARTLVLEAPDVLDGLDVGDSVAVDGACLTAVALMDDGFSVEVIGTTLSKTLAGRYREGSRVNLERAMKLGDRLDGHLVQGHVDGVGELVAVREDGDYWLLDVRVPEAVARGTVLHGSIAVNGISLTVASFPADDVVRIGIIPHTWKVTNLRELEPGDPVNLEGDLIGKYVGRMLGPWNDRLTPRFAT